MNKIQEYLLSIGLETPMIKGDFNPRQTVAIEHRFIEIMELLGLDLTDDSLMGTPKRIAKMYVNEIFSGLDYANFPKITCIDNKMNVDQMICVNDVDVSSTCEHHFVVIDGFAKVAYIPDKKIIGLSKINRIVDFFSRRPQVQERLTQQINKTLAFLLETENVAVSISAKHYCVKSRGIKDSVSTTTTSSLGGAFLSDPTVRSEFYAL